MSLSSPHHSPATIYGTTILSVRRGREVVIAADGQVSLGNTIMKSSANKLRKLGKEGNILAGFAGATADAFTLFERLEGKLEQHTGQMVRACVELAKDWRTDRYLRRLEAMMIVVDRRTSLLLSGTGDVIEPEDGVVAIGSGGLYALAAARALMAASAAPSLEEVVRKSMHIAADICVFTNHHLTVESLCE